jgi:hypothetical protein
MGFKFLRLFWFGFDLVGNRRWSDNKNFPCQLASDTLPLWVRSLSLSKKIPVGDWIKNTFGGLSKPGLCFQKERTSVLPTHTALSHAPLLVEIAKRPKPAGC